MRNAIHSHLTAKFDSEAWYDQIPAGKLLRWQSKQIIDAKDKLARESKKESPGRLIAELHFGFWTSFFNGKHARTGIGFSLVNDIFSGTPQQERNLTKLDAYWNRIRRLRNRVFHHERILHWKDLDDQHSDLLKVIGWISPELQELAKTLDRFSPTRRDGLSPWMEKTRKHWAKDGGAVPNAGQASKSSPPPEG